ncbi:MAG TPA: hypothetical protein VN031_02685 [Candidatus Microsaccharimonas sp.]|nr:hypothetical protein [Candidatus Microsaccharimonas sp.]
MSSLGEQGSQPLEAHTGPPLAVKFLGGVAAWALSGAAIAGVTLANESRDTTIASHEAVVTVTHDDFATVDGGAAFPSLRYPLRSPLDIGVHIDLGPTEATSGEELIARYGAIASQPSGEIEKVSGLAKDMLLEAGVYGGIGGLAVPGIWMLVGPRRRKELRDNLQNRAQSHLAVGTLVITAGGLVGAPVAAMHTSNHVSQPPVWQPIVNVLPGIDIPKIAQKVSVESNFLTDEGANLLRGGLVAFQKSQPFYESLTEKAHQLAPLLHQPEPDETVVLFVADRHDNLDVDPVDTAIGEAGGATVLADGGDDTSSGQPWESFSLDSLISQSKPFKHRLAVSGNHDHGTFVSDYLAKHGFETMNGKVVTAAGIRFLGLPDPKSSGFVNSASFASETLDQQSKALADIACRADQAGERISTLLVHEAGAGQEALARGCVDLVLGGHLHRYIGPTEVVGENGKVGYSYTTTTAGGAAFAISLGPLRRDAGVTLVTYRDGVPVGLQKITVTASGEVVPSKFIQFTGLENDTSAAPLAREQHK